MFEELVYDYEAPVPCQNCPGDSYFTLIVGDDTEKGEGSTQTMLYTCILCGSTQIVEIFEPEDFGAFEADDCE